jgi:hypothetical protein
MYEDHPVRLPALEQPVERTVAETWCHWHGGFTDTGRLVAAVEQGSGPGAHRYACAPCRKEHRLTLWNEPADT